MMALSSSESTHRLDAPQKGREGIGWCCDVESSATACTDYSFSSSSSPRKKSTSSHNRKEALTSSQSPTSSSTATGLSSSFSSSSSSLQQTDKFSVFNVDELLRAVEGKALHAQKIWRYIIQKNVTNFREIPDLPKRVYHRLENSFSLHCCLVENLKTSSDGSTTKLLLKMQDGSKIEICIMRYGAVHYDVFPDEERLRMKREKKEQMRKARGGGGGGEEEEGKTERKKVGEKEEKEKEVEKDDMYQRDEREEEKERAVHERKTEEEEGSEREEEEEEKEGRASRKRKERKLFKSNRRATVCLSAQVGCGMGCTFCATGTMGRKRNLHAWEILEQLYHATRVDKIRNVVFMGMGEPLDNYTHVVNSIKFMTEPNKFALGNHHICISTVGIPHRIKKLSHDLPSTRLALSLHAPDQPTRLKLMPRAASTWKLEKILEATDDFIKQQKKVNSTAMKNIGLLVEYILIKDVNDTRSQAHALGKILKPRADAVLVNLIPYNPTAVPYDYKPSTPESIDQFLEILRSEYSIKALVRQTLGQDIDSACGQLVIRSEQEEREKRERKEAEEKGEERGLSSYSYHLPFFFSPSFSCCLKKFDVSSLARKVTGSDRGVALTLASSGGCLLLCFLMMAMMRKRIRER